MKQIISPYEETAIGKFSTERPELETDPMNLSVSKIKTFKDCPCKFRFSYIEKLPKKDWEHLKFGNFLHEVLENFHKYLIERPEVQFHLLMKEAHSNAFKNWGHFLSPEVKKEAFDILCSYLKILAEQKQKNELPTFLNLEKTFYINIVDKVLLHGFIDRVQRDIDDMLHVGDYKTTKKKKYLENDPFQLQVYAYAMCLEDPSIQRIRTSYILLRHNFEMIIKEYSREQVMAIEPTFLQYAQDIEKEKLFRPQTSPLCKFCDYLELCGEGQGFVAKISKKSNVKEKKVSGFTDW